MRARLRGVNLSIRGNLSLFSVLKSDSCDEYGGTVSLSQISILIIVIGILGHS